MRKILLAAALALASAAPATAGEVAITMDDLPVFGYYAPMPEATRITDTLLAGFRKNRWQVTGFVNEVQFDNWDRKQRIELLNHWLDAGMDLGNHSYSHLSLTRTPVDTYIADVARGDAITAHLLVQRHRHPRYYRHPFLETGPTLEIRQQFEGWLSDHGYKVAPVSMENSDWQFVQPYDEALAKGDAAKAESIRQAYLTYTRAIVPWYQQAAKDVLGREPRFIFLIHASRLNAASIDDLAEIFRAHDLKPISLDKALKDPAYAIPDTYAGPNGIAWETRWAMALKKPILHPVVPKVPDEIIAADNALTAEHSKPATPMVPKPGA